MYSQQGTWWVCGVWVVGTGGRVTRLRPPLWCARLGALDADSNGCMTTS
jgi:hypothetical protein